MTDGATQAGAAGEPAGMTAVATLQAETMTSVQGFGARIIADSTASGGALVVDSAVIIRGTVKLSAPAGSLTVRAHTDGTAANMIVAVDGVAFSQTGVTRKTWADYLYGRALAPGSHAITIRFLNPQACNLYLDSITFAAATTPLPPIEITQTAYVTGYTYADNSPPNSDAISHPTAARPHAGGTGTYADPVTMAVGFTGSGTPDLPYGTMIYVPTLRRYFRIEDLCGACHGSPRPPGASIRLDAWVGGKTTSAASADALARKLTGSHIIIRNPAPGYVVASGEIALTGLTLYGETPVKA